MVNMEMLLPLPGSSLVAQTEHLDQVGCRGQVAGRCFKLKRVWKEAAAGGECTVDVDWGYSSSCSLWYHWTLTASDGLGLGYGYTDILRVRVVQVPDSGSERTVTSADLTKLGQDDQI